MITLAVVALTAVAAWAAVRLFWTPRDVRVAREFEERVTDALALIRAEDTLVVAPLVCLLCDPLGGHPDDVLCPSCLADIAADDQPIPYAPTPYVPGPRHGRHR